MTAKLLIPMAASGLVALAGSAARLLVLNAPGLGDWMFLGLLDSRAGGQLALGFGSLAIFVVAAECLLFSIVGLLIGLLFSRTRRETLPIALAAALSLLLQVLFSLQVNIV